MTRSCQLGEGLYWQSESRRPVPESCLEKCGQLMAEAEAGVPIKTDIFDADCDHSVEYSDTSLQRLDGNGRLLGLLSTCVETGDDAFAHEYSFECPYN